VRIEDLDTGRVRPGIADQQLADLAAIGLDWDGEVVRQSERTALYEAALAGLDTYPCYCTRREIREAPTAPHGPAGSYPGTCAALTAAQRAAREAAGRRPALRLRAAGRTHDFVVRRNDGAFAYNLAVVVDDADQGVAEVVRGEDLRDTTPRQLLLYERLEWPAPRFVHVPLVLGPDGERLAKRHGAITLGDVQPTAARRWMLRSLKLASADPADFDPAVLPGDPAVFPGAAP